MVSYRILWHYSRDGEPWPFGVAYQSSPDEDALLFVPYWRTQERLEVKDLSELTKDHCPRAPCRSEWSEVRSISSQEFRPVKVMIAAFDRAPASSRTDVRSPDNGVVVALASSGNRTQATLELVCRQGMDPAAVTLVDLPGGEDSVPSWKENPFPPSRLPRTGEHLIGREQELKDLTRAWKERRTNIVQIVAPGGVGKTQLVKKWRESFLDEGDRGGGAVRAFDWSFYVHGTEQQASADDFFDQALRWFGEPDPTSVGDPWAKGARLAQLVKEQPTLLILDGLEPLQHPPGAQEGELSDLSLQVLLRGLGVRNPGMCVVTTRAAVPDLDAMSEPWRVTVDLNTLTSEAGASLLRLYGVTGSEEELRQASDDVQGHALALILLGTYLRNACGGDVVRRSEALLFAGSERYAAHAHKVMASYEAWLEREDDIGQAAVAILHLIGLFNRPADSGCVATLRAEPPIPRLTKALFVRDRERTWNRAVERLRAARLLAEGSVPSTQYSVLDAHPLVREHFAGQLEERHPDAARKAHRRLYEHLKQSAPEHPDNLNDMMPLYHAVAHGCKAELWQEAFDDVYMKMIHRRDARSFYSWRRFGKNTLELATLSCFFKRTWHAMPSARR